MVKNSISLKAYPQVIVCFSSALGPTLLLSASLHDKVTEGRDVYQLIDWSHEDWIHHLNERAPLSSHLLLPALSFLSREMSSSPTPPIRPSHSLHQEKGEMYSPHNKRGLGGGDSMGCGSGVTCSGSHGPCLDWVYVALIFVAKIWSDLVLLSKCTEALSKRWTQCHRKKRTQKQEHAHNQGACQESAVCSLQTRALEHQTMREGADFFPGVDTVLLYIWDSVLFGLTLLLDVAHSLATTPDSCCHKL